MLMAGDTYGEGVRMVIKDGCPVHPRSTGLLIQTVSEGSCVGSDRS
jgi:hypothetical protein